MNTTLHGQVKKKARHQKGKGFENSSRSFLHDEKHFPRLLLVSLLHLSLSILGFYYPTRLFWPFILALGTLHQFICISIFDKDNRQKVYCCYYYYTSLQRAYNIGIVEP
jgi:hypothetical protein